MLSLIGMFGKRDSNTEHVVPGGRMSSRRPPRGATISGMQAYIKRISGGQMAKQEIFDAIIVGSGATGGWAAKELAEAGTRVIVLEAGRKLEPEKDFTEHKWPYEMKFRGQVS